jgi:hypothetical protein
MHDGCSRAFNNTGANNSVLEKNVSEDSVLWFKTSMYHTMQGIAHSLSAVLPSLAFEHTSMLLMYLVVLISGLWPIANPPPVVQKVLERSEFNKLNADFSRDLEPVLIFLMTGMKASES